VRVSVDLQMCVGHAQCSAICPTVFTNDDEGYAQLVGAGEVPAGDEDAADLAVESCPEQAIAIVSVP
jgi:ferredoxin